MENNQLKQNRNRSRTARVGLAGAVVSAVAASVCCVGPLLLMGLGVSGAWISRLTLFEAYRPLFIAVTVLFLGMGFYRVYRRPKEADCAAGSFCANPLSRRINRITLWTVTLLVAALLLFPYAAPYFLK